MPPQPDGLDAALQRELGPGEYVRWQGRPLARVAAGQFGLWLFAIPWTAFALFWTSMAWFAVSSGSSDSDGNPLTWAFPLFGVPFILVGLGMLSVPFMPLIHAPRTLFAITNKRVLRLRLDRRLKVESVAGDRFGAIRRSERRDGSGTLTIGLRSWTDSDGDRRTETFDLGEVPAIKQAESHLIQLADELKPQRAAFSS